MTDRRDERLRRHWDREAEAYDRRMAYVERRYFADTRAWLCRQAVGATLEVACGTGLNLPHLPDDVQLTGVERSTAMLALARRRATALGRPAELLAGDACALPFPAASFDTVVCTFALCGIPRADTALAEMVRVLRPGGLLLLADHVAASHWPIRVLQGLVELATVPLQGEHYRRRPARQLAGLGLEVERHDRFALGMIERLAARTPGYPVATAG